MISLLLEPRGSLRALGLFLCAAAAVAGVVDVPVVFTQAPAVNGEGGRLVVLNPDGGTRVLTEGFQSAADPEVSFDGKRILFAGKRVAGDRWQIFEMNADGSAARQVTRETFDCRQPVYQSVIFNLAINEPWRQVAFVGSAGKARTNLFTVKMDGSGLQQVTHNPSSDMEPALLPEGRMIYSGWGRNGRVQLFGVNLDGTDYALFNDELTAAKRMACATDRRQVVFVESSPGAADGAGRLAALSMDRPLHTRRALTAAADGLFHSPSALPGGGILVSRRTAASEYGIWKLDPATGRKSAVHSTAKTQEIQAKAIAPRQEPDGRGSVVDPKDATGILYCLNANTPGPGVAKRVRILAGETPARPLGEFDLDADGSFKAQIPANVPVRVQTLDARGNALKTSAWFWVRNKENRGCIGCHEDGELSPPNRVATAIERPPVQLTPPEERRKRIEITRQGAAK